MSSGIYAISVKMKSLMESVDDSCNHSYFQASSSKKKKVEKFIIFPFFVKMFNPMSASWPLIQQW